MFISLMYIVVSVDIIMYLVYISVYNVIIFIIVFRDFSHLKSTINSTFCRFTYCRSLLFFYSYILYCEASIVYTFLL